MAYTRKVHVVRIDLGDAPAGSQQAWLVVKVLDQVAVRAPNGEEILYDVTAANADPYIRDDTGGGNGKGDPSNCTRSSHMARLTSSQNPPPPGSPSGTQALDVEVLDAFSVRGPNGEETAFVFPSKTEVDMVTDNTGSGLAVPYMAGQTTRALHVAKISLTGYTINQGTSGQQSITTGTVNSDAPTIGPPAGSTVIDDIFFIVERTDALAVRGPNGQEYLLLIADKNATENDITQYGADGKPPLNTDPNVYVSVPANGTPFIGKNPIDSDGVAVGGINQGPLWWLTGMGTTLPTTPPPPPPGFFTITYTVQTIGDIGAGHLALEAATLPGGPVIQRLDVVLTGNSRISLGPLALGVAVRLGVHPAGLFEMISADAHSLGENVTVPNPNGPTPPTLDTTVSSLIQAVSVINVPDGQTFGTLGPGVHTITSALLAGVSNLFAVPGFYSLWDGIGSAAFYGTGWQTFGGAYGCVVASDDLYGL
jgi:hypothetical protein